MKKTIIRLILAVSLAFSSVAAVNVSATAVKQENVIRDNKKVRKIKESKNSKALEKKVKQENIKQDNKKVRKIKESKNSKALEKNVHKNNGKEIKESDGDLQPSKILQYRFENIKKLKQHIANLALYIGATNFVNKNYDGILTIFPVPPSGISGNKLENVEGSLQGSIFSMLDLFSKFKDLLKDLEGVSCKKINLSEEKFNELKEEYLGILEVMYKEWVSFNEQYNANEGTIKKVKKLFDKGTNSSIKKARDLYTKNYIKMTKKVVKDLCETYIKKIKNEKLKKALERKYKETVEFIKDLYKTNAKNISKQTIAAAEAVIKTSNGIEKEIENVKKIKFKDVKDVVTKLKFGPF